MRTSVLWAQDCQVPSSCTTKQVDKCLTFSAGALLHVLTVYALEIGLIRVIDIIDAIGYVIRQFFKHAENKLPLKNVTQCGSESDTITITISQGTLIRELMDVIQAYLKAYCEHYCPYWKS